jgi:hypothetical protein
MSPFEEICLEGSVLDRKEQKLANVLQREVVPRRESTEGPRRQGAALGGANLRALVVSHDLVPSRNGRARLFRRRRLQTVYEGKTRRA